MQKDDYRRYDLLLLLKTFTDRCHLLCLISAYILRHHKKTRQKYVGLRIELQKNNIVI